MLSSRLSSIFDSVHELGMGIRVNGGSSTSISWVLAEWSRRTDAPLLVIAPQIEKLREISADLHALSDAEIWTIPTWETSPYGSVQFSIRTRMQRMASIHAASQGDQNENQTGRKIFLTSLPALIQRTLPPRLLQAWQTSISVDQEFDSRETLLQRLRYAGYLESDPVEDPGNFAVRGEIIDVFPPGRRFPIRIELFDSVVEKIREFDPDSQRTRPRSELDHVLLPPAREIPLNDQTVPRLRSQIKEFADSRGIHRKIRDPITETLQSRVPHEHLDAWAPFAFEEPATLLDHLSPETKVIWLDEMACLQEVERFLELQKDFYRESAEENVVLPEPQSLFPWEPNAEAALKDRTILFFDTLQMLDPTEAHSPIEETSPGIKKSHQIQIKTNSDLTRLSTDPEKCLAQLKTWFDEKYQVQLFSPSETQSERIRFILEQRGVDVSKIQIKHGLISSGFRWPAEKLVIVRDDEIVTAPHRQVKKKSVSKAWAGLRALSDLSPEDLVVHVEHGIGRYLGLVRLDLTGAPSDFIQIEYAGNDKLYLPVYRLNLVQKYAGGSNATPLSRLGGQQFAKTKEKVRESVQKLAVDLVQLYAKRSIQNGFQMDPRGVEYREFEASFPFTETEDQLKAIDDTIGDLESGKVMDRLVCGDVGYGKTEVAIRAAYQVASSGKQVAVLVPTTLLAHQHEQSFLARLKETAFRVESLSRLKTAAQRREILDDLAAGKIDIIVGTHALLAKTVQFKNLGLVVVDEEHRFGVAHKERLKTLKLNTHVLTLTATPIPRTLHFALSGLRDISIMTTAPVDRLPIRTFLSKYNESVIKRAIQFELSRGGQVFFVHNRVDSIYEIASKIREILPHTSVTVAHGQMGETELEKTMMNFYRGEFQVLVCTTIVESGLDVPNANTIVINRADALGLAQLYQLRGRVGRSDRRAHAYLLVPESGKMTKDAVKRLEVIQRFVELGSGFNIASHDLEIRGGGNLLGPQQSGHIASVGFDLYTDLLEEAIADLKNDGTKAETSMQEPEIKVPFPAFLHEDYVPDVHQRLTLYRRLSSSTNQEVDQIESEMEDRYGALPMEALNLLWIIRVKDLLKELGVEILTVGKERISVVSGEFNRFDPEKLVQVMHQPSASLRVTPDSKILLEEQVKDLKGLYYLLDQTLTPLAKK